MIKKINFKNVLIILMSALIIKIIVDVILSIFSEELVTALSITQIIVDIVLVIATITLANTTNKVAKDTLKVGNYSLIEIDKLVYSETDNLNWGCALSINSKKSNQQMRIVFFVRELDKRINIINKIKVLSLEFYDKEEINLLYKFNHIKGNKNDSEGYLHTEMQTFRDKSCPDNGGYRIPILLYFKEIDELKEAFKEDFRIKMEFETINQMNIKTKALITFNSKLGLESANTYVGKVNYAFFNNIETEYK